MQTRPMKESNFEPNGNVFEDDEDFGDDE